MLTNSILTRFNLLKAICSWVLDLISSHGSSQILLKCFETLSQCSLKTSRENSKNLQKTGELVEPSDCSRRATRAEETEESASHHVLYKRDDLFYYWLKLRAEYGTSQNSPLHDPQNQNLHLQICSWPLLIEFSIWLAHIEALLLFEYALKSYANFVNFWI